MESRDVQFKTWYWNNARLISWDHHTVVEDIEGKDLKVMQGKKDGQGGLRILNSRHRSLRNMSCVQKVLVPGWSMVRKGDWNPCRKGWRRWRRLRQQWRRQGTKTSSKSPVEIKEMAVAAKFRNPVLRKDQRKKETKARR